MTKPDRCRNRFERLVLQALRRMDRRAPIQAPHCVFTPDQVVALLRAEHEAVKRMVRRKKIRNCDAYNAACDDILAKLMARGK
jgi:hypothetical protein